MASILKGNPAVAAYDILNEPESKRLQHIVFSGTFTMRYITQYVQKIQIILL